jgi:hypothetical protein
MKNIVFDCPYVLLLNHSEIISGHPTSQDACKALIRFVYSTGRFDVAIYHKRGSKWTIF